MACTLFTTSSPAPTQPPAVTTMPAPVNNVWLTLHSEGAGGVFVNARIIFGPGDTSTVATIRVDGTFDTTINRVPNGEANVLVMLPRDGRSHQVCAE